ncbi:protein crumbs-like [Cylas formicarius]|uniref:protein crumbs-like n=1 Tax=Cylas formicarius TaxID=197179 RepID=UPI002958DDB3|nr:protein crumbs-like [Cylas formicarius]
MVHVNNFLVLSVVFLGVKFCISCENGQTKQGCLIRNLVCSCGIGCVSDYRYDTIHECQNALRGKKKDICKLNNPCQHGGTCIQISQQPGYKCRCEGTGYFGMRCNRACPVPGAGRIGDIFPYECIVI